jgi:hypothetical protein
MLINEIENLKENLDALVLQNLSNITSKDVVELSQKLDVLIVEYLKNEFQKS